MDTEIHPLMQVHGDSLNADGSITIESRYETKTYTHPDAVLFCLWVLDMGEEVNFYRGRYFYEGPSVNLSSIGDVVDCPVKWQHDQMGKGYVIYPVQRDPGEAPEGEGS